ncbi:methylase [Companilactobacillus sp. RD055328]|uniref:16S rRNA (guanine(966)-N(2))-methyltransferase RsmD n=1 Tax=Companilactobacillus sp. RD055328 TaxID=2916634 RepID=UPI001FC7DFC4|nr:16S rRNA (guanine(966)-N(2))-methyltransferase RsmD [Companilactobacillus sp. RD055328]GKQ42816.1 methylase [Companilactobacillus sp. RD055328]
MRVVSGEFRGLNLKAVPGDSTRPTSAKVKESIFSIINPYLTDGICLDLFAGTGSLGIEAVSRGYETGYLVDKNYKAIKTIKENIEKTHSENRFIIQSGNATDALKKFAADKIRFDLIFLDPPYRMHITDEIVENMISEGLLNDQCIIVIETDYVIEKISDEHLTTIQEKTYGETQIVIYKYEE